LSALPAHSASACTWPPSCSHRWVRPNAPRRVRRRPPSSASTRVATATRCTRRQHTQHLPDISCTYCCTTKSPSLPRQKKYNKIFFIGVAISTTFSIRRELS
ncbi:unnamed protein product, partial [Ascophyllum nodosum]